MPKFTVHVTRTYSVEIETKSKNIALETAQGMLAENMNEFESTAEIFEVIEPDNPRVVRGRGSY